MAYRALYRSWRPRRFADLIGQDLISRTLKNANKSARLAHAYLFCGPRGTGKTSAAKILACAVNCLAPLDGEPCCECANCQDIISERFVDVVEIDAASNRGIDEMRNLKEQVRFAPLSGKYKVYIIDEVHMLTTEAFNALLKTLEEPPNQVLFILATTDVQKIPPTVLSRVQRFDFHKIANAEIITQLAFIARSEKVTIDATALAAIARASAGGMRDAISLLDQAISSAGESINRNDIIALIGGAPEELIVKIIDSMANVDYAALIELIRGASEHGIDAKNLLNELIDRFRHLLLLSVSKNTKLNQAYDNTYLEEANRLASRFKIRNYESILKRLAEAASDMRFAPDAALILEVAALDVTMSLQETSIFNQVSIPQPIKPSHQTTKPLTQPLINQKAYTPAPVLEKAVPKETEPSPTHNTKQDTLPLPKEEPPPPSQHKQVDLPNLWAKVMTRLHQKSVLLHAFLKPIKPISLTDHKLVLEFPKGLDFHIQKLKQPENLSLIAQTVEELIGDCPTVLIQEITSQADEIDLVQRSKEIFTDAIIEIIDE